MTIADKLAAALDGLTATEKRDVICRVLLDLPTATASDHVRQYFLGREDAEVSAYQVYAEGQHSANAVQQAMHRMAKRGELVRSEFGRYRLRGTHDATATWSDAKK